MQKKIKAGLLAVFALPLTIAAVAQQSIHMVSTSISITAEGDTLYPGNVSAPDTTHSPRKPKGQIKVQYGVASYYSAKFEGRKTYTDEIFRQRKFTAASNTLPMHTWVKVTNLRNDRTVYVRINDKMHPRNRRLIDLSRAAAKRLGFAGRGLTRVRVDVLGKKKPADAEVEEPAPPPAKKKTKSSTAGK